MTDLELAPDDLAFHFSSDVGINASDLGQFLQRIAVVTGEAGAELRVTARRPGSLSVIIKAVRRTRVDARRTRVPQVADPGEPRQGARAVATALTSAVSWEDETVTQLAKAGAIVFEPRRGRFKIGTVQETIIVVDVGRCASRSWVVDCEYRSDPSFERRGLAATSRYPEGFATWFGDFDDVIIRVQQ